jgi:hypothetical protein
MGTICIPLVFICLIFKTSNSFASDAGEIRSRVLIEAQLIANSTQIAKERLKNLNQIQNAFRTYVNLCASENYPTSDILSINGLNLEYFGKTFFNECRDLNLKLFVDLNLEIQQIQKAQRELQTIGIYRLRTAKLLLDQFYQNALILLNERRALASLIYTNLNNNVTKLNEYLIRSSFDEAIIAGASEGLCFAASKQLFLYQIAARNTSLNNKTLPVDWYLLGEEIRESADLIYKLGVRCKDSTRLQTNFQMLIKQVQQNYAPTDIGEWVKMKCAKVADRKNEQCPSRGLVSKHLLNYLRDSK